MRVAPALVVNLLLIAIHAFPVGASAQTAQDFDAPGTGTPYVVGNHIVPPAPPAPGPELIAGGPTAAGRFLRLAFKTPIPSHNSIAFDRSRLGSFDLIVVDFDFRMIQSVGSRADGLGFAFLSTANYGTEGRVDPEGPLYAAEEPNFKGSLGIGFDIYQNPPRPEDPGGDFNNNHLSVHFDKIEKREFDVSEFTDLAGGQWIHAHIILRPGGGFHDVSVILTPQGGRAVTVVDKFPVDGFNPYDGRIYFAARSGGESAHHDLDNVNVQFLSSSETVLSLGAVSYVAVEGDAPVKINVSREGSAAGTASVRYGTRDLTATAPADYEATSGILTFGPGETTKSFTVPIVDDLLSEGDETFQVFITDPSGAVIGGPSVAAVTLVDIETARLSGRWTPPIDWPVVPIHMHLMPTGKVLFWAVGEGGSEMTFSEIRSWDPQTGLVSTVGLPGYDVFCSGHVLLPNGTLFVTGGHDMMDTVVLGLTNASVFDSFTNSWLRLPDMNNGRWYPTNTVLAGGDVLVTSGDVSHPTAPGDMTPTIRNTLPQVWDVTKSTWRNLDGALSGTPAAPWSSALYPRMFLAPDGRVFKAGPDAATGFLDTAGTGTWTNGPLRSVGNRDYGSAVMYDGKVLLIGGGSGWGDPSPPTNSVESIDLNASTPTWALVNPMQFKRRQLNATLLPNGQVLVTGGTSSPGFNDSAGAVLEAEIWDPMTGTWSTLAPMAIKRGYHSTALLLPDGRVLVAGGGQPHADGDIDHKNAEIFSPPYLFKGPRPTIAAVPTVVTHGQTFFVETPDVAMITKVTLIRLGSVTHAFDQNQRLATLSYATTTGGLNVTVPGANVVPPGHYMLFIVNSTGVPSIASITQVLAVETAPTISAIADQTANEDTTTGAIAFTVGDMEAVPASLTVSGSSSNTTLVPNANITLGGSGASRTVTLTPAANQSGTATITVTVSDGGMTASTTFSVTVTAVNDAPTITAIADQTTNEDVPTGATAFTVNDVDTAVGSLTVSGNSSNPTLVPNTSIVFGGSGASRTVTLTPAADQSGAATITVTVSDGSMTASTTFSVTVTAVNDAPTITAIADQTTNEDTATGAIPFTVEDVETAAASLTVSGSSSSTTLVPNANIALGGSGPIRTVTLTPAANQSGTATITVTVSDGSMTASTTFSVTVTAVNDAPTITAIADQTTNENTATGAIAFMVGDVETAAASLTVSGSSSNTTLVPNANIALGGSGASRTVTLTPAANQSGTATITVTVSDDGSVTASRTFVLTVTRVKRKRFLTDVDGDGKSDLAVFRPSIGGWFIRNSAQDFSTATANVYQWGLPGDVPIAADFDGDGKIEISVFRPPTGQWFIRYSAQNYSISSFDLYQWGLPGDIPIAGDFDGDGKSELAVFRPSIGGWFIRNSSQGYSTATANFYQWGLPGDVPIAADFDGDGRTELTVFRPPTGQWFIRYSSQNYEASTAGVYQWGLPGDIPLAGDFDGDGKNDLAVFRPPTGEWFIRYSSHEYNISTSGLYQWGLPGDVPVVVDFDADGKTELAVFRPSIGGWFIRRSSQGYSTATANFYQWGLPGDVPLAADLDSDGKNELAVYRPPTGEWFILYSAQNYNISSFGLYQWGLPGDIAIRP